MCSACASGTFSVAPNTLACQLLTECSPGKVITIGNAMLAAQSMGGSIVEIRAYSSALSGPKRTAIENELKAKYMLGYTSCADILSHYPNAPDGHYTIDPDGPGGDAPLTVTCMMPVGG